jgi:hypothetical protein
LLGLDLGRRLGCRAVLLVGWRGRRRGVVLLRGGGPVVLLLLGLFLLFLGVIAGEDHGAAVDDGILPGELELEGGPDGLVLVVAELDLVLARLEAAGPLDHEVELGGIPQVALHIAEADVEGLDEGGDVLALGDGAGLLARLGVIKEGLVDRQGGEDEADRPVGGGGLLAELDGDEQLPAPLAQVFELGLGGGHGAGGEGRLHHEQGGKEGQGGEHPGEARAATDDHGDAR